MDLHSIVETAKKHSNLPYNAILVFYKKLTQRVR